MKKYCFWAIVLSALSFVMATAAIIYMCFNGDCAKLEQISFGDTSVAILAAIVGLLVAWNIYSVIDIKTIRDEYNDWKIKIDNNYKELNSRISRIDTQGENKGKILNVTFDRLPKEKRKELNSKIISFCKDINISPSLFMESFDRLIYLNGGFADKYIDNLVSNIKENCDVNVDIRFSNLENSDVGVPIKTKDGFKMPTGKPLVTNKDETE